MLKGKIQAQDPQDLVLSTNTYLPPEGQRTGNKRQRQEIRGWGEGKGNEREVFVPEDTGLSQGRKETDLAHRKMVVYKGKRVNPVLR